LHTGKPLHAMPDRYAPYQTAHRYYLCWNNSCVLENIAFALFDTDAMLVRPVTRRSDPRTV
jgi:hypothetical protein